MTNGAKWTPEEDQICREVQIECARSHEAVTQAQIAERVHIMLPHRTIVAIVQHFYTLDYKAQDAAEKREKQAELKRLKHLPTTTSDVPVVGWRIWEARPAGIFAFLESVASRKVWPAGEPMVAHSLHFLQENCGIFAFDHRRSPKQYEADYFIDGAKDRMMLVRGSVYLWGKILVCEQGYKAEFAYPDVIIAQDHAVAQGLRRTYGCEVIVGRWEGFHREQ